jgi:hypothetical protein
MKHKAFEAKTHVATNKEDGTKVETKGYEAFVAERTELNQLFDFDDKFATFYPEEAKKMIVFNAQKTGVNEIEFKTGEKDSAGKDTVTAMRVDELANLAKFSPFEVHKAHKEAITKKQVKWTAKLQQEWLGSGKDTAQGIEQSFGKQVSGYDYDSAFGLMLRDLVPKGGLYGFALAALFGMVVSALAAMLNAVSTLFTMDIYKGIRSKASETELVWVGRISIIGFVLLGCSLVPVLADPRLGGVFTYIQEFQGFVSPGILCAFMFGFFVHKAPRWSGIISLLMSPAVYGALMFLRPNTAFLDRMGMTFTSIVIVLVICRLLFPMKEPFKLATGTTMDLRQSKSAMFFGFVVVVLTVLLYVYYWDHTTPMFDGFWESFGFGK